MSELQTDISGSPNSGGPARPIRLLIGLFLGLSAGLLVESRAVSYLSWIAEPIGALWLDALTMTVIPLIFGLLVTGVSAASRSATAASSTFRALAWMAGMLTVTSLLSAILTSGLLTIWPLTGNRVAEINNVMPTSLAPFAQVEWYRNVIPSNPIRAAADMAIIPLVIFALFLGFAIAKIENPLAETFLAPLRALTEAMLIIVNWVLWAAPMGVAALAFTAIKHIGVEALGMLAQYVLVVSAICIAATLLAYCWVLLAGKVSLIRFARYALPAQIVAIGTQSSLASLPVMVAATKAMALPDDARRIVLPLAVSLFRAASVAANVAVTIFLAKFHGIPVTVGTLLLLGFLAVPLSLAAVGLPAQISFFATIAPLCLAAGIPVVMLPLLLAIEAIPDIFRTLGNVTSDLAVADVASEIP